MAVGRVINFDIPASAAHRGLNLFAEQANIQLLYPFDQVQGLQVNEVRGSHTLEEGLRELLSGTCLQISDRTESSLTLDIEDNETRFWFMKRDNKNCNRKGVWSALSAVILSGLAAAPAAAQEGGTGAEQVDLPRGTLEEIVVTAEHRTASIQDTTISMSALSAENIQDLGISNGTDIDHIVPNVTITNFIGGRTGFGVNIRGIGNNESLLSEDPAVGMYIDGVLISKNTGGLLDVLDMERLEVLRGPQGSLYGRNTMGGAINIVTKQPSHELEGRLMLTVGNYEQRDFRGMINIPLVSPDSGIGAVSLRASLASINRDGIQNNRLSGAAQRELGDRDREIAMTRLLWEPTDRVQVTYGYDRTRIDEIPEVPWATNANPVSFGGPLIAPYLSTSGRRPSSISVDSLGVAKTDVDGHSLHVDYDISETATFKSITAHRKMENRSQSDADGTPVPLILTLDHQTHDFFSQEFRLVGTGMEERLDYSVGVFYMEEDGDIESGNSIFGAVNLTKGDFDNKNWALYGQASFMLSENWRLTGGVRYTNEDRSVSKSMLRSSGEIIDLPRASGSFENVSPMVALDYNWSDAVMLYGKVSTGFQSGGFNIRDENPTDFIRGFDEEELIAYELGIKSTFYDMLRVNAAVWFSDYDDKRVADFNPDTLGNTVRNAGVVEIYGSELEVLALLNDYWQLGINYGYTKAEYKKYDAQDPENPGQTIDLSSSSTFPFIPEHDLNVNLSYEQPLNAALLKARVDWSYKDGMTFQPHTPERNSQGSYGVWNARLSLEEIAGPANSVVRVSLWAKNLSNKGYWNFGVNMYDSFGFDINTYGQPRTFGIDLAVDF